MREGIHVTKDCRNLVLSFDISTVSTVVRKSRSDREGGTSMDAVSSKFNVTAEYNLVKRKIETTMAPCSETWEKAC